MSPHFICQHSTALSHQEGLPSGGSCSSSALAHSSGCRAPWGRHSTMRRHQRMVVLRAAPPAEVLEPGASPKPWQEMSARVVKGKAKENALQGLRGLHS